MHIEFDNATIRMSETTLRELLSGVEKVRKEAPHRRTVLLKSEQVRMRFLVDIKQDGNSQPSYDYSAVVPGIYPARIGSKP